MYTLTSSSISVHILDPKADQARLGSRYCTGGYIWQVTDAQGYDLLTGPEYPAEPNTFDGQGMPDMFFTPLGAETAAVGDEVGVIGVGRVRRTSPVEPFYVFHNREVIEFLDWQVEALPSAVTMRAETTFRDWSYAITRSVRLDGEAIFSRTTVSSTGADPLPIRWFAHPFFPHTPNNVLCRFSMPVTMEENPGFFVNAQGFVCRKPEHDWKRGWYQPLVFDAPPGGITVEQMHPLRPQVAVETDFAPGFLPIWGNEATFSFEPYFIQALQPGETASWEIVYRFQAGR